MKEIKLSQFGKNKGKYVALVDDEDYDYINQWKWHVLTTKKILYAIRKDEGNINAILMHRMLMQAKKGMVIDHINHNGLDNQKNNLRECTFQQNLCNKIMTKGQTKYKGVYIRNNKYISKMKINGKLVILGKFVNIDDAARSYDEAAKKYHGEFANLNFKN